MKCTKFSQSTRLHVIFKTILMVGVKKGRKIGEMPGAIRLRYLSRYEVQLLSKYYHAVYVWCFPFEKEREGSDIYVHGEPHIVSQSSSNVNWICDSGDLADRHWDSIYWRNIIETSILGNDIQIYFETIIINCHYVRVAALNAAFLDNHEPAANRSSQTFIHRPAAEITLH
jgi:hypothetical protein